MFPTLPDVPISVTPWSKQASRNYEAVNVQACAICEIQEMLLLLTRKSGLTMGIRLTAEGVERLAQELLVIQKRLKAHQKEHV